MNDDPQEPRGDRIAKVMAAAGLCSRRQAEAWIAEGRVMLDGRRVTTPATLVTPDQTLVVDGKAIDGPQAIRMWLYHKPAGLITTHSDEQGRATVFDRLPRELPRVVSVGRLDLNSEGLLLLTTSGALARQLELPDNAWKRRYRVRIDGVPAPDVFAKLARGVTVEGVRYGAIEAKLDGGGEGRNQWLEMGLQEGKNREIRRVMEHFGFKVSRLIRLGYGPFQLGNLVRGGVREVQTRALKEALGREAWARLNNA